MQITKAITTNPQ